MHFINHFLIRNVRIVKNRQKTLEWPTIINVFVKMAVSEKPRLFPFHCPACYPGVSFCYFLIRFMGIRARSRGEREEENGEKGRFLSLRGV